MKKLDGKKNLDDEDRYYHATGNPRIKDLQDDIKDMELVYVEKI